jgi:hypothetical protein
MSKTKTAESVYALQDLERELAHLPIDCVETTRVDFEFDAVNTCLVGDMVMAPHVIAANQVLVHNLLARARPGSTFRFDLVLKACSSLRNTNTERVCAVTSLALHAYVDVFLHSALSASSIPLVATFTPLLSSALAPDAWGVSVCIAIPEQEQEQLERTSRDRVCIDHITIAGESLAVHNVTFPVSFDIVPGVRAPQTIPTSQPLCLPMPCSPAISHSGTIFVPTWNSSYLYVFTGDGAPLTPLWLSGVGLSQFVRVAVVDDSTHTLLLADQDGCIVAVNTASFDIFWRQRVDSGVNGMALLDGVVFVSSHNHVFVFKLVDGTLMSCIHVPGCMRLAADAATATMYISSRLFEYYDVEAYEWDAERGTLEFMTQFSSLNVLSHVIVVPAPRGSSSCRRSYLVVTLDASALRVFALPERQLVYVYNCPTMVINGLAVDPCGTALAVYDDISKSIQILPWPLPGMPSPL